MAKTVKKSAVASPKTAKVKAGAASGKNWSQDALLGAIRAASDEERVKTLRAAGIINNKGGLTKRYKSWGKAISMTEELPPAAPAKRRK